MIIRAIFWVSLAIMLVPVSAEHRTTNSSGISPVEVIIIAKSVVGDVSGFCTRNPGSCRSTREMVASFSERLRAHSLQLVNSFKSKDTPYPVDGVLTGSIRSK